MGWSYCGINQTTGEEMGYSVTGVCHYPGCDKEIDHGLSYMCGGMHEGGKLGCGYYYCTEHLSYLEFANPKTDYECFGKDDSARHDRQLCEECCNYLIKLLANEGFDVEEA